MAEVLLGQTGSSPGLQTLNLVRYADNGSLTMTSLVWMERRKGIEVDSRESRCKNDSNVKGGVEVPGTGLGMG